jgi:L-cysteate sulfo-lyase
MVEPLAFGTFPTPLESAPRLAAALGLAELWIKRDDLIGLGGGGNKARKLRFTAAEALAAGATTLITTGAPQSNHARATAAVAARLGLRCVLVLAGDDPAVVPARTGAPAPARSPRGTPPVTDPRGTPPVADPRGNLLLDRLAGAEVIWAGERTPREVAEEEAAGRPGAYLIPFGGSSPTSVRAYAECARELTEQADFDQVVVAMGSGGTMAGLVAGLGAGRVLGVDVGAVPDPAATVRSLLSGAAELAADVGVPAIGAAELAAGMGVPTAGAAESVADAGGLTRGELVIDRDRVGPGYATVTGEVRAALRLAATTEGLFLDPIYTGRAMAGLIANAVPGRRVVFVHTGGLPGLFGVDQPLL